MVQDRVIPSFIEQLAMRHYEHTDVNAGTIPWGDLPRVRRQILIQATTAILNAVLAYVEWDEAAWQAEMEKPGDDPQGQRGGRSGKPTGSESDYARCPDCGVMRFLDALAAPIETA